MTGVAECTYRREAQKRSYVRPSAFILHQRPKEERYTLLCHSLFEGKAQSNRNAHSLVGMGKLCKRKKPGAENGDVLNQ